ncbi:MAG: DNA double-strand break repair nuclease NurA [Candidatus ainarchaeum sp.]|nr:DNA double-strand break repair nuclease NurA [Candidatus ainarchaeum sp.]
MLEQLKNAAEHINEISSKIKEDAERIRKNNFRINDALEREMIIEIKEIKINGKVGAVDGGLLSQEMHGVDLVIARGAGVIFEYENSAMKNVKYYPDPFPKPKYSVKVGLEEHESNSFRSLFRLQEEIENAIQIVEKFSPKIILMDGSLIPLPQDKPNEENGILEEYLKTKELYKKLYSTCEKNKTALVGVIKDSRGKRFMDSLKGISNINSSDSIFLDYLLKKRERTCTIKVGNDWRRHPILKDFIEWEGKINLFYMKTSEEDRPMRVEFLSGILSADEIAGMMYSLNSINKKYAYPAILIEADLRAMLDAKEMERMQRTLQMFSHGKINPLRRNSRPFR